MADAEQDTGAKVEFYRSGKPTRDDKRVKHRWRAKSSNGRTLSGASESYYNREDMLQAMRLTRDALIAADLGPAR